MLLNLTLNKVIILAIGLCLVGFGIWYIIRPGGRITGVGLFFTGIGNLLLGITDGFVDMSPLGRIFYRVAILAYIIGLPVLAFAVYRWL